MTQKTVKAIARAFGFTATWKPEFQEWRIAHKRYPSDSYFTSDHDDAVFTLLAAYQHYRSHNLLSAM